MKTTNPGKQRRRLYNSPLHKKRKWLGSHLEENLLLKYDKRSTPIVKGDTVRVMRGSFRGHEDKVAKVNTKKNTIEIEGITMMKADGNKIAKPVHPSNVMITKLNLTDKWRRKKLERGLSEETRKEIEKEAAEQLKEAEDEQKRVEEEQRKLEEEAEKEEDIESIDKEEIAEKPKEKIESKPKAKPKTEKKTPAKPAEKKAPAKKTTTKKAPSEKPNSTKKSVDKKPVKKTTSKSKKEEK